MRVALDLLVLLALILFPQTTSAAAVQALRIWGLDVVPSLFPYMIFCRLLAGHLRPTRAPAWLASSLLGLTGGSPSGAAVVAAYADRLSRRTLLTLCALTGTVSPMFMLGTVRAWTHSSRLSPILLAGHLMGALLSGLVVWTAYPHWVHSPSAFRALSPAENEAAPCRAPASSALTQSIHAILHVGGCILCYSVLASLLSLLPLPRLAAALLHGLLEVSGGTHTLCTLPFPFMLRAVLLSLLLGFSGLSILSQNLSQLRAAGVRMAHLIGFALLRAALCACATLLFLALFTP